MHISKRKAAQIQNHIARALEIFRAEEERSETGHLSMDGDQIAVINDLLSDIAWYSDTTEWE